MTARKISSSHSFSLRGRRGSLTKEILLQIVLHLGLFLSFVASAVCFYHSADDSPQFTMPTSLATFIAATCLFGSAIIVGGLIRRKIVDPLRDFTEAIEMIRKGEKEFDLPEDRDDELGRLAQVFRRMISSIQERDGMLLESNRLLEVKIGLATADLRSALEESQRAQSILFGQQRILSKIATSAPQAESFDLIVAVFQEVVPNAICAVMTLDPRQNVLKVASTRQKSPQFLSDIEGLPVGGLGGVCGLAAERGALQMITDISADHIPNALREAAQKAGISSAWAQPIISRGGQMLGTFSVFYTSPCEPETEEIVFADMLADLAGIAIERASAEEDLISARDKAEFAVRAKSDFLANMSHEIRTPMNGIVGLTELALDLPIDGESRGYLEMIRDSSHSLMEIINDVLDFSKAEAQRIELELTEFDLYAFIERTLSILSIRARQKSLVFVSKIEAHVPRYIRGDVTRIGQIFNNLVTNAIKFTNRDGGVFIYIDSENGADGQVSLRCAVTDTGIGIAPEKQEVIFDVFTQADSSTTRCYGGTGLGLSICRQLVGLMQGTIRVNSRLEIGTAFHFDIRVGEIKTKEVTAPPPATGFDTLRTPQIRLYEGAHSPKVRRVLVADDNPVNLHLATRILEMIGVEAVGVVDGMAVLDEVQKGHFDLILMDCQMPKLDGYEVAEAIRKAEEVSGRKSIPIVALTAHDAPAELQRCIDAGMNEYLQKPFRHADLARVIERCLDGRELPSERSS